MLFVFLYFRFIINTSNSNERMPSSCVLSNETMYHMELTASKIQTTKDIIKRKKINEFVIDETLIKEVGSSEYIWLWVAIEEPGSKRILDSGYQKSKICL